MTISHARTRVIRQILLGLRAIFMGEPADRSSRGADCYFSDYLFSLLRSIHIYIYISIYRKHVKRSVGARWAPYDRSARAFFDVLSRPCTRAPPSPDPASRHRKLRAVKHFPLARWPIEFHWPTSSRPRSCGAALSAHGLADT